MKDNAIKYWAFAENADGKLEQLRVVRLNQKPVSQVWTGKIYESQKEADKDMILLNCS